MLKEETGPAVKATDDDSKPLADVVHEKRENHPGFDGPSQLTGMWAISTAEFYRLIDSSSLPSNESRRDYAVMTPMEGPNMIVVAIKPDGTFDWEQTRVSVPEHWNGLAYAGDTKVVDSKGWTHRVLAANYSPTASMIEVSTVGKKGERVLVHDSEILQFVWIDEDHAKLSVNTFTKHVSSWYKESYRLHRVKDGRIPPDAELCPGMAAANLNEEALGVGEASIAAGRWARTRPGSEQEEVLVAIEPDGTFEWSGTFEGVAGGWNVLERAGDTSTGSIGKSELVSCRYTPHSSTVQIRTRIESSQGEPQKSAEFVVKARSEEKGKLCVELTGPWGTKEEPVTIQFLLRLASEKASRVVTLDEAVMAALHAREK